MNDIGETSLFDQLIDKIRTLSEGPWEQRCRRNEVMKWLENARGQVFDVGEEKLHLLHLLSVFTYFGEQEVRVLLRSMYRDLYRYPIVEKIRLLNDHVTDVAFIEENFRRELGATRFLGMGDPSESGAHLLYYFRQENSLHKGHFITRHDIFRKDGIGSALELANPTIRHYVFIDDFCGSGTQARQYSAQIIAEIRRIAARASLDVSASYIVLAATSEGMAYVRANTLFDQVHTVLEFDGTYKTFSDESRYFPPELTEVTRVKALAIAEHYGRRMAPTIPLGYGDGQLLLGFHHNVPDNTLPVIWATSDSPRWVPIFKRFPKIGG